MNFSEDIRSTYCVRMRIKVQSLVHCYKPDTALCMCTGTVLGRYRKEDPWASLSDSLVVLTKFTEQQCLKSNVNNDQERQQMSSNVYIHKQRQLWLHELLCGDTWTEWKNWLNLCLNISPKKMTYK